MMVQALGTTLLWCFVFLCTTCYAGRPLMAKSASDPVGQVPLSSRPPSHSAEENLRSRASEKLNSVLTFKSEQSWKAESKVYLSKMSVSGENGYGRQKITESSPGLNSPNVTGLQDILGVTSETRLSGVEESSGNLTMRHKRSLPGNSLSLIPAEYGMVVHIHSVASTVNQSLDTTIRRLKMALATEIPWPLEDIRVDKINFADSEIEFYFRDSMGQLVKVKDIMAHDLLERVSRQVPDLGLTKLGTEESFTHVPKHEHIWSKPFFPYAVAGCSVVLAMLMLLLIYCCCCRNSKKAEEATDEEEGVVVTHAILYPALKPELGDPTPIQPDSQVTPFAPSGITTPIPTQPIRIKAKGLLERRGSNASLTLDLNPSHDSGRWEGTPPKESTALEFLMSAGNRLSRRDLRNAVKHTKILYEEFWEIPMNHTEKVYVAGSGMKNRYKTIIPNEHSRVILPDIDNDPLNSYINANYIRGYEGEPHAYIATQGPMAHTILDFWRMIWSEKCPIIVMITKLKEKSKPKCENYLPEQWGMYGDIEIVIDKVVYKKGYVLRHITLRCNGESQSILHYWYTAWPDHKPPDSPNMLLDLVKEVELRTPRGPVCVHCSAGIGRTGCFVAISIGIRQLREEHSVDALGVVCSMRMDRGGMIQTHEQYDFVHQALAAYERELGEPSVQSITALTTDSVTTP